ncbi:MAG TPA: hypothetical protein PLY93_07420, partial [Turneriella sp.]|nr:hypothetical protein [Turneriella sp.]
MESTQTIKTPPLVALKNTAMEAARNHEQKVKEIKKLSNYRWRMFWSGAWAGLVTVSVFLVSLVSWGTTLSGWLYARLLNFGCMRILGIKIKVEGMENLPTAPSVILINHQSNLDAH